MRIHKLLKVFIYFRNSEHLVITQIVTNQEKNQS